MRRALSVGVALALAVVAATGWGAPSTQPPRTAEARRAQIAAAEQRLLQLVDRARQDPRLSKVERYLSWSSEAEFINPKRDVRVVDLVEILRDEAAPLSLRERARDALKSVPHRGLDPDLSVDEAHSKRAAFSRDRLVPLLVKGGDSGEPTRGFAAEILDSYWHFPEQDIRRYNSKDESTWRRCADAYRRKLASK